MRLFTLLMLVIISFYACSYDKENLKKSPSDRQSQLYPMSCDYNYAGVDSGQNTATKRCR